MHNLVFVQYVFDGREHEVDVKGHGNTKGHQAAYYRTSHTTKERLKELCSHGTPPTAAFYESVEEKGGVKEFRNAACHSRNIRQIKHVKKTMQHEPNDQMIELIEMQKEGARNADKAFVRKVETSSDPYVVLATNHQLNDVVRFCCNPAKFSVLGVDPTFNFGKYYVTVTTYRHLLFRTKQGTHPVRIGPVMVHNKKETSSYYELSSTMVKLNPETRKTLVYGTDGEKALGDGFGWPLVNAQHLLCDLHMKDNISAKLHDLGIRGETAKDVMNDIFGKIVGSERVPGLIDAASSDELNTAMENLKVKWASHHGQGKRFVEYFLKHKLVLVRQTMTADIRAMSGLGWPPAVYDQDPNECMNSVLQREKQRAGKKDLTIPEFARLLASVVRRQRTEEDLALIGVGDQLFLDPDYETYGLKETLFYRKTKDQQNAVLKKFYQAPVNSHKELPVDLQAKFPTQANTVDTDFPTLSVPLEKMQIVRVPFAVLARIYNNASVLLQDKAKNIIKAPGEGDNLPWYVLSEIRNAPSYIVTKKRTARHNVYYECSNSCIRFTAHAICAHTIAVAEIDRQLEEFVRCYKLKYEGHCNLNGLVHMDQQSGRGKKKTKSTQRRKGTSKRNSKETVESYVNPASTRPSTSIQPAAEVNNKTDMSIHTVSSTHRQ